MKVAPDQIAAVVLAGGFGTRIQHLLPDLPKPMAPVCGRPFVEWIVRYLAAQNIRRVILSTGYRAETVEKHFSTQPVKDVHVGCVPETRPLGTAGGFLNAVRVSKENPAAWLVLNGDSLALINLQEAANLLNLPAAGGVVTGVRAADASRYGTVRGDSGGRLSGFREKQPGAGTINAGVYLFQSRLLDEFPEKFPLSFENDVFPPWLERGINLRLFEADAPFLDIGTPESLPQAEHFIRQNTHWFSGSISH